MPNWEKIELEEAIPPDDQPCMLNPKFRCTCKYLGFNRASLWDQAEKLNRDKNKRAFFNRSGFYLNAMTLRCLLIDPEGDHYSPCTDLNLLFPREIKMLGQTLKESRILWIETHDSWNNPTCHALRNWLISQGKLKE
jgi:hypothetical protein